MTSPNLIIYLHVIVNILCHTHENVPALEKKLPPIYFTRDLTQVSLAISKCRKPHNSCEESYNKTKTLVTCLKKKSHYDTWGRKRNDNYTHNIQSRSQLSNNRIWRNAGEVRDKSGSHALDSCQAAS